VQHRAEWASGVGMLLHLAGRAGCGMCGTSPLGVFDLCWRVLDSGECLDCGFGSSIVSSDRPSRDIDDQFVVPVLPGL
jgi:hypothetical protein